MLNKIDGLKTYIVAASIILSAVSMYLTGEVDLQGAVLMALNGLGLATLRHGVSK